MFLVFYPMKIVSLQQELIFSLQILAIHGFAWPGNASAGKAMRLKDLRGRLSKKNLKIFQKKNKNIFA